jgi:signal transduction histidine kinase
VSSRDAIFGPGHPHREVEAGATPGEPLAEARVEQLLALNKAAVAISSELELDNLLQRIVDIARDLVKCNYAALGVLGDDGYIERFPTSGISKTERETIGAPPRGHGLLGVMLRAGRSLRIPDMSKDPRRVGFPPHHPPMTSLLGVPIFARGQLMGDLYLTDKIDGPEFSEEDEWLVQLLATHAATALTNAGLHAEKVRALAGKVQALELAGRERARSDSLFKVSQAINSSVHLGEVIQLIVHSAAELLGAAGAAVHLLERVAPEGLREGGPRSLLEGRPRREAARSKNTSDGRQDADDIDGIDDVEGDVVNIAELTRKEAAGCFVARYAFGLKQSYTVEGGQLPVDRSVAGRAVKSGLTQVVDDVSQEPDLVFPSLAGEPLRSIAAVPLTIASGLGGGGYAQGREMLGVLSAYSDRTHAFDQEAVRLLEAFGAVASTALYNAGLYEEAHRGREAAEREQERLRELEQMKDEFLSTAAHELRTPLTTIRMSAGLALEQVGLLADSGRIDSRIVDLVALIVEGSQRMHSLVNDLLDLTRLEQGRAVLSFEDLDLREVVGASVQAVAPLFENSRQRLDVRLPEFRCPVRGDRPRLEQVVINLLSNANKYSPPDTQVEIRSVGSGDECLVTVRDMGPGVPEDEQERIFERFYRSNQHRNDRTSSTGLGLPIARKVAEVHKGRLWVAGAPGGGSIFTLALPRAGG